LGFQAIITIFALLSCYLLNMEIDKINLYRMTHICNIPHILKYGITHKHSANADAGYTSIGDSSLINFRDSKEVYVNGNTVVLGDYIPFYFGIRMPMLYVIQHGYNYVSASIKAEDIVYIVVSLKSIREDKNLEYVFSDGHATDSLTTFYDKTDIESISDIIDWESVTKHFWYDDLDIKRKKQAEFLIKGDVNANCIIGYVCYNIQARKRLVEFGIPEDVIKVVPTAYY